MPSSEKSKYTYDELARLLNWKKDDLEEWAIEAISNQIIDARID